MSSGTRSPPLTAGPCLGPKQHSHRSCVAFDKMQQHTGAYYPSGILHSMPGPRTWVSTSAPMPRMDTNVPISAEGLKAAETANRIIWGECAGEHHPPHLEELAAPDLPLQKGDRGAGAIVTIPGGCLCSLCNPHRLYWRGGPTRSRAAENYKGGVRLSTSAAGARAGSRAGAAAAQRQRSVRLLSASVSEMANAVHRVYDEYTALKFTPLLAVQPVLTRWLRR